jgi:DNA-binding NarL/FixJ family response regulator
MEESIEDKPLLTLREQEILESVANGWSAKQVARQLDIAPRTVETHIGHMRAKMCARNTAHMIGRAFMAGVLTGVGPGVAKAVRAAN